MIEMNIPRKDYQVIYCDWKEDVPIAKVVQYGREYKHYYQLIQDDGNYIIFSDFRIKNDQEAEKLVWLENEEILRENCLP